MNDLVVDSHLETIIVDDKDANTAAAVVEGVSQTREKTALVKDGKTLLDIASLGHGNNATVLADVENTVLLEDRTKHVLDNDRRSRVGDEAGLLMELLGEEVNTEVTVLASLGGGGDADNLARAALKDQEIANADVVAGDGDGVRGCHLADWGWGWASGGCDEGGVVSTNDLLDRQTGLDRAVRGSSRDAGGVLLFDDYLLAVVVVLGTWERVLLSVVVVVAVRVDGVGDAISNLVGSLGDTVTERVIMTVVVVISHITLVLLGSVDSGTGRFFYSNLRWITAVDVVCLPPVGVGIVLGSEGLLRVTSFSDDRTSALAELTLSHVNLGRGVVGGRAVDSVEVSIVGSVLNLDVGVGRLRLVAVVRNGELDAVCVLRVLLGLSVARLLVDMDFLAVLGTTEALFLVDADLFFDVRVTVAGGVDGGREGFVDFFVTFPSV